MKTSRRCCVLCVGLALLLAWAATGLAASPPERVNFQGVLRDAAGAPVVDGTYEMLFRFFGNGAGACDCGEANASPGCSDAACQSDVCGVDPFCCSSNWDTVCAAEAEPFVSCQTCIADEEVLVDDHTTSLFPVPPIPVRDGLFQVALGSGAPIDGSGAGTYGSLGELFRDFGVVYVEIEVAGETLSPRIRVEASAFTQNALQLEGKRAVEFLDTSATPQEKAGGLTVQDLAVNGAVAGDLQVNGTVTTEQITFLDGTVQSTARPADPPCFDATNRFVDCGNGTATDTVTGLIWLKNTGCITIDYPSANEWAASLEDGDCNLTDHSSPGDWRLPTEAEWQLMVTQAQANSCTAPFFPDTAGTGCCGTDPCMFLVQSTGYWTSSTIATSPINAWIAQLNTGNILPNSKTNFSRAWPVRNGR